MLERKADIESSSLLVGLGDMDAFGISPASDSVGKKVEVSLNGNPSSSGDEGVSSQTPSMAQSFSGHHPQLSMDGPHSEMFLPTSDDLFIDSGTSEVSGARHGRTTGDFAMTAREDEVTLVSPLLDWRLWLSHLRTFVSLLKSKTVLLILLQGAPGCIPWVCCDFFCWCLLFLVMCIT